MKKRLLSTALIALTALFAMPQSGWADDVTYTWTFDTFATDKNVESGDDKYVSLSNSTDNTVSTSNNVDLHYYSSDKCRIYRYTKKTVGTVDYTSMIYMGGDGSTSARYFSTTQTFTGKWKLTVVYGSTVDGTCTIYKGTTSTEVSLTPTANTAVTSSVVDFGNEAGTLKIVHTKKCYIYSIIWTPCYTVTYDGNDATSGSVPTDSNSPYASGSTVTVLGNTGSLAKTGNTFSGWNTAANGSGTGYVADNTFSISANTTLYAQWTETSTAFSLTLNDAENGTIIATVDETQVSSGSNIDAGKTVKLTMNPTDSDNYYLKTFTVSPTEGSITTTKVSTGVYTFTMPSSAVTVSATFAARTDISTATVNLSESSFTYNGTAQAPTVSSVVKSETTYTVDKHYTINEIISQTNVGSYTVTVTGIGSCKGTASASWSITQATNTLSGTLSISGWTYGSTANSPSGVTAAFGTVGYKYSSASDDTYGTYDDIVNGAVGTWWVKAYVDGTDNYTAVESEPVSFTISSAAATTYSVSAVTSTGNGTYGTVSAEATSLEQNGTTTITATPATGYQVTNWAVSGEGASISPSGDSNSNTTTLTMGTADATVTVIFGPKSYTVTLDNQSATTAGTASVAATYNASTNLTSNITCPAKTGYIFGGYFTAVDGGGVQVIGSDGAWIASVSGYTDADKKWVHDGDVTLYAKWTSLAAFSGTKTFTSESSDTWTATTTNTAIYSPKTDAQFMALSRVDGMAVNSTYGLRLGKTSSGNGGALVFYVGTESDITVNVKISNSCDATIKLDYMGTSTDVLTTSNYNTAGTSCDSKELTSTSTTGTLTKSGGASGYYKVYSTALMGITSLSVTTSAATHSVSAVTSTGENTYGTVSAASGTVAEGGTTTITAVPATGYQVTSWAVSGTGATIDPSGDSNSNTTTLTMGTADATVTVTFGAKSYTVTLNNQEATTAGTANVTATYNAVTSNISCPAKTGYIFGGYYTAENGGGTQLINSNGAWIASVSDYTDGSTNWVHDGAVTLYAKWTAFSLAAFSGTKTFTSDASSNWTGTTKNIPQYSPATGSQFMALSEGENMAVNSSYGLQLGKASGGALVFYVGAESDITVNVKTNTTCTVKLDYMGTSTDVLTTSNYNTAGTSCDSKELTSTSTTGTLTKSGGAAGYYKVYSTALMGITSLSVTGSVTEISSVAIIDIDAPVKGSALDTDAICSTTGIESVSVEWKHGEETFSGNAAANTAYTAVVTLTAASGYAFAAAPTATISGNDATVTRTNDTQITVSYTFAATAADAINATITAETTQSTTYNGQAQSLTASVDNGQILITYYTNNSHTEGETTTAPTNAGTYYAVVSQSDANYTSTPVNVTFTINKATLTATADNKEKVAGAENPDLTFTVTGFVNGETAETLTTAGTYTAPTAATTAVTDSEAGTYDITVSGGSADNYDFNYVSGTLTVTAAAEATVSAVTTWTFNDYTASETATTGITVKDDLYNRSASSGRGFTISSLSESQQLTFNDKTLVTVSKIATGSAGTVNNNNKESAVKTAGASGNFVTPFMAFNATVAGTCYALFKGSSTSALQRIYFTDGSVVVGESGSTYTSVDATGELTEVSLTSTKAGSFFIGSMTDASAIYAIRFVPAGTTYNITLPTESVGGSVTTTTAVVAGTEVTLTVTPSTGYQLKEGTLKATYNNGSEQELTITDNKFTMPAYPVTVSAEFEPITYSIAYTLDGGTVATENPTSYTIETEAFTLNNPTKENCTFAGWTGTGLNAATTTVTIAKGSTGDRAYTATWTENAATTYNVNIGSGLTNGSIASNSETAEANATVTLTVTPVAGYTVDALTITDADNATVTSTTVVENYLYSFTMPAKSVSVSATFKAASPIGTWDFQSWASGSDYINGGEYDSEIHYLERNSNGVFTGRVDKAKESDSKDYYTNILPFNGVFGASSTNLKIRKNSTPANNGLFVGGSNSSSLTIYGLKQNNCINVSWTSSSSAPISVESGKLLAVGSNDAVTSVVSGTNYIVQADGSLELNIQSGSGNPTHINKIVISSSYTPESYALTSSVSPASSGTVTMKQTDANGDVIESGTSIAAGTTVYVSTTPADGYKLSSLKYGNTEITDGVTNGYGIFTMPSNATTVTATFESIFGNEEVVSTEKNWFFNGYTAVEADAATASKSTATDGLYNRVASGRSFGIISVDENNVNFNDGTAIAIKQIASCSSTVNSSTTNWTSVTAGSSSSSNYATPFFAFNASVAGTCYALVKSDGSKNVRIYFGVADGSTALIGGSGSASTTSANLTEISLTSDKAGVFFIGGMDANVLRQIYAIRFVPSTVSAETISARKTLTLPIPTGGRVSVTTGETATDLRTFESGTSLVLTPNPSDGFVFTKWTNDSGDEITEGVDGTTKSLTLTLTEDRTVKAVFTSTATYAVTYDASPTGGTVAITGADDLNAVSPETVLTIQATPSIFYNIGAITVTDADNNPVTVGSDNTFKMPSKNVTVAVTFTKEETVDDATTWTFGGLTTGTSYNSVTKTNSNYYLRAADNDVRKFTVTEWANNDSEDVAFTDGTVILAAGATGAYLQSTGATSNGDKLKGYTAGKNDTNGTPSFAFNATKAGTMYAKIKANSGDYIRIWFSNGTENNLTTISSITGTGDIQEISYTSTEAGAFFIGDATSQFIIYGVRFVPTTNYTVTATKGEGGESVAITSGTTNIDSGSEVASGTSITMTATASSGYTFKNWTDNNNSDAEVSTNNPYTFILSNNTSLKANFAVSTTTSYNITKASATNGTFTLSPESAAESTVVTITTEPVSGYEVDEVTVKDADNGVVDVNGSDNSYTFTMPAKNVTVTVTFKAKSTTPTETWTVNYAQLATGNVTFGESPSITADKTTTKKVTVNSTEYTTYPFSYSTILSANDVWVNRDNLLLRFKDVNTIGLYHANATCFRIKNVQAGDIIEVAYNGTALTSSDLYNASLCSETGTYTHNYNYSDKDRTFDYTVYTLSVTADGDAAFVLPAGFLLGKITVGAGYTVSAAVSPDGAGQVNITSPTGKEFGKWFLKDTQVEVTAVANGGYAFEKWEDNSTDNPRALTVSSDLSLTASFKTVTTYTISASVSSSDGGSIIMTKNGETIEATTSVFSEDDEVTLTAKHKAGYKFVNWTAGEEVYSTEPTITLKNVNKTLTANFETVAVYGTYDFKTWATDNVTTSGLVSVTWDEGDLFADGNTMALNNAFVAGSNVQIRKNNATSTGLVMKDNASDVFTLRGLTAGNWLKITSSESALKFSSTNVKKLGEAENVTEGSFLVSDETYVVTSGTEVALTFAGQKKTEVGNDHSYIYSVTLSDEAFYDIGLTAGDGGTAKADASAALPGNTITITVTPEDNYMVDAITVKDASNSSVDVTTVTENSSYTFEMPASNVTVTVTFKVIPTIYGTYDFRSFANSNLTAGTTASIGKTDANVMTGSFTGITNTMTLNDAFGIKFDTDAREIKLARGEDDASTGIAIPRGSADQVAFYLYGLKSGEWFKLGTGDIPLYINKVNNTATISFYDLDDPDKTNVARNAEIVSGHTYVASGDISSMEFCYNTSNSGNIYLYTAQISNGDAVPAPTIGSYDFATGKVGITVYNSLKGQTPTVYYTTNGDEPTTSSTVYSDTEKITLSKATTIKAIAVYGEIKSTVAEKLVVLESVDAPTIGDYDTSAKTVAITTGSSTNTSATLTTYYTLDGSTPSASSTKYTEAIAIDQTRWVKAVTISSTGVASDVTTKKITVSGATPATTWDFVNDETLATLSYNGTMGVKGYYYSTKDENNDDFQNITNSPIHSKMAWLTANGSNDSGVTAANSRPFAITDLAVGDKIYVTYSGGTMSVSRHSTYGNTVTVNGTEIGAGALTEFESGAEIIVTAVDETYNYVMLKPSSNTTKITKIEINPIYYEINIDGSISNGTVTSDMSKASAGSTVTLTTTPAAGYGVGSVTVKDASNQSVTVTTVTENSSYTFKMPASDVTVSVAFESTEKYVKKTTTWTFGDLTATTSYNTYAELGAISGGLYTRAASTVNSGFTYTVTEVESAPQSFADGTSTTIGKVLTQTSAVRGPNAIPSTAMASTMYSSAMPYLDGSSVKTVTYPGTNMLAFNAQEAGTLYVIFKSATAKANGFRIYNVANGTTAVTYNDTEYTVLNSANTTTTGAIQSISATVSAGAVFFGDVNGSCDIYGVKFIPASEAVTYTLTVGSPENGTITATVDGTVYEEGGVANGLAAGATVTLTAMPDKGYQLSGWTDGTNSIGAISQSLVTTMGMTTDLTASAVFTAQPETPTSVTSGTTWTFDNLTAETALSGKTVYEYNGLYISGHNSETANFATVKAGSASMDDFGGAAISSTQYLSLAGGQNSESLSSSRTVNTFTQDAIGLSTGVSGTVYALMQGTYAEGRTFNIYVNGEKHTTAMPEDNAVTVVSQQVEAGANVFIATSAGAAAVYAVKFVPADGPSIQKVGQRSYRLSNGLLTVTIGDEGYVDQIETADGTEIMKEGGTDENGWGYFSYNTSSSDSRRLFKSGESYPTVNIVKQTSDMVEIVYTNDQNSLAQTWSVGYIMRSGVNGLYTYAKVKNGSTESDLPEARFVWRPDRDNFNYGYVSDDRQGEAAIPSYSKFSGATSLQDATYKFSDGTIYTKYDWANFVKDDQVHGVMSSKNGLWVITPSYEWINGGVQKQDLMVHADDGGPVLLQMMQSQHFGAASHTLAANEEKFFGPSLLYLNSGSSKDAMISDAKTMAESEVNAWPYSWFTNDDYPQRSKVTGTITLSNTDFKTTKIQVILADNSVDDPLVQSGGYQYATEVESTTGSYAFTIPNVRPGTYALFAYALNGDATGVLKTSRTYTMPDNKGMGTIAWEPKKYGETLWQIGEADHSTSGFGDSNHARQYGLWDSAPTSLTYTVGTSSASDWYYVQPKGSTWTINFDCTESFSDPLRLTIAIAGASRKPTLVIKMNDHQVHNAQYTSDDPSVYRSATLSGQYGLIEIEIPANNMVVGTNTLTIAANSGSSDVVGLMYDCIKLESPKTRYVVGEAKTWVFGELTTGTQYKAITPVNEEYYLRTGAAVTGTSTATRTFTVTDATSSPTFAFADGTSVSTNTGKYLKANGAYKAGDSPISATSSAGSNEGYSYPMFAFNISEAGSVYAKVKGTSGDKFRIYFANGSSIVNKEYEATGDIDEISYTTSEAGSIFITDVTSAFEIHAVRFSPTSTAVKYDLTVGSPENGTITATVAGTAYAEGTTNSVVPATEVTLTATPAEGYQLKGWTDGSGGAIGAIPQSIVTTTDMPKEALTVTATFEALPALEGVTSNTTWTFSSFTTGTALSDDVVYGYNNGTGTLYIGGHGNANAANMATVKAGSASGTLGSTTINATSYLALAGGLSSESLKTDRTPNTYTKDAIGFYAGAAGTIYVLMQGAYAEGRTFNIYVNGTRYTKDMPEDNAVTVVSQEIDAAANVFIATSAGEAKIYAVKFVVADEAEVTTEKKDDNNATVTDVEITEEVTTVTIPATDEDGTPITAIADDVFTAENTENVAVIDLSETQVTFDGTTRETVAALKNINSETLIYLPETANVTGTNVVTKSGTGETATYSCTDYELTDGKNAVVPHSFKADHAKLNRTFIADKKCTVCLPYDFTATGGTFYMFTGISNGKVQMTAQTDGLKLKANTPYIFVPNSDENDISATNVEVSISDVPQTDNAEASFSFIGTFEKIIWSDNPSGIYGFAAEEEGGTAVGQFVHVGSGASILGCRAYLKYMGDSSLTDVAATRGFISLPDAMEIEWLPATAGITSIDGARRPTTDDDVIYNMRGQRVDSNYKGLVIKNGKKMVIK